jgi:uncharacterized protein (DUF952 family)
MDSIIYRIAPPEALASASLEGVYRGEVFDQADGFIHASSRAQLAGTLAVHYADAERLAVAVIEAAALGDALRWEVSRGGEKFPHIYGDLPWSAVTAVHLLKKSEEGWRLPEELTA